MRRTQRTLPFDSDALDIPERIRASLTAAGLAPRAAGVLTAEMAVLYYALAAWRRKPFTPPGARAFSYHRRNSLAAILYTVFFASVVEAAALHFLVRAFAPRVALALLVISALGAIWVLGFARSVQLRPILVSSAAISVRSGIQLSLDIARDDIARIDYGRVSAPKKGTPGYLRATLGQPNVLLELRRPVVAHRAYGGARTVNVIGLVIDDVAEFQRTLA